MKFIPLLVAGVLVLTGCETETSTGTGARGMERLIRVILDSRSQPGYTLSDDMFKRNEAYLEQLRTRGLPSETVRDLERVFRDDIEQTINEAIIPIYSKTYTAEEITTIAGFLSSAPGKEFIKQSRTASSTAVLLDNADPALRAQIREFFLTPTGRKFLSSAAQINEQARLAIQELSVTRAPQRNQAIQQVIQRAQAR